MTEEEKQIYQEFEERFKEAVSKDKRIQDLAEKLANGTATYKDAWEYANKVGHAGSRALIEQADQLIAEDIDGYETIMDALYDCYDQSATYAAAVQTLENQKAGLGIKGAQANFDRSRASGIAHLGSNAEDAESASRVLGTPVEHFTENVVGDTIKANEEFQYRSGLNPQIKRTSSGKCCQWCDEIAGIYDYPAPDEVYRRHQNCNCLVEYHPGNRLKQNVHTKRWSKEEENTSQQRFEKVSEAIGRINQSQGLTSIAPRERLLENIVKQPRMLGAYTPEGLKDLLSNAGFEVKPLGRGDLKGLRFEEGGGYRVNFGGDGMLQYHPAKKSHHTGEYYKISKGKGGVKRYDRFGNILVEGSERSNRRPNLYDI